MAVSGARAENYLYLEISGDGTSATLMYGDNEAYKGKPYYQSDGIWATGGNPW